jgi:hypothetical protein
MQDVAEIDYMQWLMATSQAKKVNCLFDETKVEEPVLLGVSGTSSMYLIYRELTTTEYSLMRRFEP